MRKLSKLLIQQSKMASMGEMIGNIAHQWRQPLSAISTAASGVSLYSQMNILTDEDTQKYMDQIVKNSEYLSNTIENFRNFFNPNKPKESKTMALIFEEIGHIVNSTLLKNNVETIIHIEEMTLFTHINELKQVILNLIKNASDAIKDGGFILIDSYKDDDFIHIKVNDSGGGIPDGIIEKIYEPYFTTKHQSIGTGLGLNMTYQIVTEQFHGTISASNQSFTIGDEHYFGALFHIKLPASLLTSQIS